MIRSTPTILPVLLGSALCLGATIPGTAAPADVAGIDRLEEFVELEGADLPMITGLALDAFALFVWRDGGFVPLNYQVDERGPANGYFGEDTEPDVLDDNDQLVFMVEDA